MVKSEIVTARISQDLYKKIKYLEINVTETVRDSLLREVEEREALIEEIMNPELGKKKIGGLRDDHDRAWDQLQQLSGEEKKLAAVRYVANMRKEVRKMVEEAIQEIDTQFAKKVS